MTFVQNCRFTYQKVEETDNLLCMPMIFKLVPHIACLAIAFTNVAFAQSPKSKKKNDFKLDERLKPNPVSTNDINSFYNDIVIVQRKAKNKRDSFLFNSYFQFDFSDGPSTLYSLNLDFGYAFNDFWEAYVNFVPYFISNERSSVGYVESLTLIDGKQATLKYLQPKQQVMLELLWAPAYGKDSWGPKSIIRSDTFAKLGLGTILYEEGKTGLRASLSVGKTFFIREGFNFRISAGGSIVESFIENDSKFYFMGTIDFGLVWYL